MLLIEIADELHGVRSLAEAAWMATSDLGDGDQRDGLQAVLDTATEKLDSVRKTLEVFRMRPERVS